MKSHRHQQSFSEYAKSLFVMSYMSGFPQISRSAGVAKRVKIFFFVLSTVGCLYQTQQFLEIFLQFPVSLVIDLEYPRWVDAPCVTVCPGNTIHKTKYCLDFPDHCNGTHELIPEYLDIDDRPISKEIYDKYGIPWEEMKLMNRNQWVGEPFVDDEDVVKIPLLNDRGKLTGCYVINQHIFRPVKKLHGFPTFEDKLDSYMTNTISIFIQNQPKITINDRKRLTLHLHSPFQFGNPYLEGIYLSQAYMNLIIFQPVEIHSLPPPYSTMCRDYHKEWWKTQSGPLTKSVRILPESDRKSRGRRHLRMSTCGLVASSNVDIIV